MTLNSQKVNNYGLGSDIYGPISFKLRVMIDISKVLQFIFDLSLNDRGLHYTYMREQKLLYSFLVSFSVDLDEIECGVTSCQLVYAHAKFISQKFLSV